MVQNYPQHNSMSHQARSMYSAGRWYPSPKSTRRRLDGAGRASVAADIESGASFVCNQLLHGYNQFLQSMCN